ncbi:hypothetical protein [Vibrio renipiscarius]|uniref:Uncharacterized protein n=1 Tax=Vibrio renipiscarius TaxID=1461322 RepID=A0A0C2K135_9VIBR|nr:hypothetical protein [Vibrio renipiscarius]KII75603.1 hypothetical protein PL18_17935 [Vibrio renipiscarius]KII81947.1 hypothetical protein OJ16_01800 [Vibrio renipiscarius]
MNRVVIKEQSQGKGRVCSGKAIAKKESKREKSGRVLKGILIENGSAMMPFHKHNVDYAPCCLFVLNQGNRVAVLGLMIIFPHKMSGFFFFIINSPLS